MSEIGRYSPQGETPFKPNKKPSEKIAGALLGAGITLLGVVGGGKMIQEHAEKGDPMLIEMEKKAKISDEKINTDNIAAAAEKEKLAIMRAEEAKKLADKNILAAKEAKRVEEENIKKEAQQFRLQQTDVFIDANFAKMNGTGTSFAIDQFDYFRKWLRMNSTRELYESMNLIILLVHDKNSHLDRVVLKNVKEIMKRTPELQSRLSNILNTFNKLNEDIKNGKEVDNFIIYSDDRYKHPKKSKSSSVEFAIDILSKLLSTK